MNKNIDILTNSIIYQDKVRIGLWYHEPEDAKMILDYFEKVHESNKKWFSELNLLMMYYIAKTDTFRPPLSRLELRAIRVKKKKEEALRNESSPDHS